jgi:hypothetical protein
MTIINLISKLIINHIILQYQNHFQSNYKQLQQLTTIKLKFGLTNV